MPTSLLLLPLLVLGFSINIIIVAVLNFITIAGFIYWAPSVCQPYFYFTH